MPLATLTELKTYLGTESASQDAALSAALDYACGFMEGATGRALAAADHVEIHGALDGRIFLRQWPVISVHSVHVDSSGAFGPETLLPESAWTLEPGAVISRRDGASFPSAPGSVRAAYRAGYEEGGVPADLRLACVTLAAHVFRLRRGIGVEARSLGQGSLHHRHQAPAEAERVISFYRRRSL